ncbi:DUF1622 domain-containing protein [Acidobacteriota bacterium]
MIDIVKIIIENVSYLLEGIAAILILIGAFQAVFIYLKRAVIGKSDLKEITAGRLKLGQSLSIGLGFLIGADILKSAISPGWEEIGKLAAIVVIRAAVNFLLTWEMRQMEKP